MKISTFIYYILLAYDISTRITYFQLVTSQISFHAVYDMIIILIN